MTLPTTYLKDISIVFNENLKKGRKKKKIDLGVQTQRMKSFGKLCLIICVLATKKRGGVAGEKKIRTF